MDIAHLLPYGASFPLKKHNGRYEWALRLALKQASAGHKVTIYAGPSALTQHGLECKTIDPKDQNAKERNIALIDLAFSNDHDIYHSHFDDLHYSQSHHTVKPIVVTQHWFPDEKIATAAKHARSANIYTVPVTHFMKKADEAAGIPSEPVIYHGIDLTLFSPPKALDKNRLLFVGRIAKHKGVYETVKLVSQHQLPLDIVGKINEKDRDYWQTILPYVDGERVRYLGSKSQKEVAELLGKAQALVFLPRGIEAFGQTIIEAQACGTPVIINDLGANSELVEQGKTGYVLRSVKDFQDTVKNVSALKPADSRAFAEKFDLEIMVSRYESLYRRLLSNG